MNKEFCSECACFLEQNCANGYPPFMVGDGICQDEYNIEECLFDGLDCCPWPEQIGNKFVQSAFDTMTTTLSTEYTPTFNLDTTECTECLCHGRLIL